MQSKINKITKVTITKVTTDIFVTMTLIRNMLMIDREAQNIDEYKRTVFF